MHRPASLVLRASANIGRKEGTREISKGGALVEFAEHHSRSFRVGWKDRDGEADSLILVRGRKMGDKKCCAMLLILLQI